MAASPRVDASLGRCFGGHRRHCLNSRDADQGTCEGDAGELCGAAHRSLRTFSTLRIVAMKYRKMKPASSIAKALMRLFDWLSCTTKNGTNATPDRARSRCHGGGRASVAASGACAGGAALE